MAHIPKVPKDKFEAVIRALLNAPPLPLSEIPRKRKRKVKAEHGPKKPASAR